MLNISTARSSPTRLTLPFAIVALLAVVASSLWIGTRQNVAYATVPDCAAAENVVAFIPGPDLTGSPDPSKALGFSDGVAVSLGNKGVITLEFAGIEDGPENDFRVYTTSEDPEKDFVELEVSEDGVTWVRVYKTGDIYNIKGDPPVKAFDISLTGSGLTLVKYIRLTDHGKGAGANTDTAGFDLDAVGVINCAPPPPPPPEGGEGCTPGFWKQPHHFDSWTSYGQNDDYETVFGVDASFTKTLLGALQQGGGGEKALGRHAVAALLNAESPFVSYAFTPAQVIAMVQNAYATGNFEGVKNILEDENERGCPF